MVFFLFQPHLQRGKRLQTKINGAVDEYNLLCTSKIQRAIKFPLKFLVKKTPLHTNGMKIFITLRCSHAENIHFSLRALKILSII